MQNVKLWCLSALVVFSACSDQGAAPATAQESTQPVAVVAEASQAAVVSDAGLDEVAKRVAAAFAATGENIVPASLKKSEIEGLYEVQIKDGPIVYMAGKGDYMIVGDLYSVGSQGLVNVSNSKLMESVSDDDMIVYNPPGDIKASVVVFTDVTCGYCRKFHGHMDELMEKGIQVKYMAFPRGGPQGQGADLLATAWCSDTPAKTMTALKENSNSVPIKTCSDNPVAQQYQIGQQLGVRGTPAMFAPNGDPIPGGYKTPDQLAQIFGLN